MSKTHYSENKDISMNINDLQKFIRDHPRVVALIIILGYGTVRLLVNTRLDHVAWEAIGAIVFGLAISLLFKSLDSDEYIDRVSLRHTSALLKQLESYQIYIRESFVPMSQKWGLSRMHDNIDFVKILEKARTGSTISIFFTYHPILSLKLSDIILVVRDRNIKLRLLLGNYESESIRRRFDIIGSSDRDWAGWTDTDSVLENLQRFSEKQLPKAVSHFQSLQVSKSVELKLYDFLPDIPMIIESSPSHKSGNVTVRRVYSGFYSLRPALDAPFIEWERTNNEGLVDILSDYFEERWTSATDVDIYNVP